jgi:hypothetical protein
MSIIEICTELDSDTETEIDTQTNSASTQKAIFAKDLLWKQNATIKIGFLGTDSGIEFVKSTAKNVDPIEIEISNLTPINAIKKVVNERIQPLVNLKLIFVNNSSTADIRISFDNKEGSKSAIGTYALKKPKNKYTMNFAWFNASTILHEFGHAIGMRHEHQGPFSNIQWDKEVLDEYYEELGWSPAKVQRNIIDKKNPKDIIGSDFDPLSIMLYFFPPEFTLNHIGTPENERLSGYDVIWITKTYPRKNGITPEDFYYNTYGISLADSLAESDRLANRYKPGYTEPFAWWKILLIIISILVLIGIAVTFYLNKRRQNQRQSYRPIFQREKYL